MCVPSIGYAMERASNWVRSLWKHWERTYGVLFKLSLYNCWGAYLPNQKQENSGNWAIRRVVVQSVSNHRQLTLCHELFCYNINIYVYDIKDISAWKPMHRRDMLVYITRRAGWKFYGITTMHNWLFDKNSYTEQWSYALNLFRIYLKPLVKEFLKSKALFLVFTETCFALNMKVETVLLIFVGKHMEVAWTWDSCTVYVICELWHTYSINS